MPIVNPNPTNPAPTPQNPNVRAPEYRGINEDLRYTPQRSLLTHIEGSPWVIDEYFSQYLNADNAPVSQNVNRQAQYQQYARIQRLEIVVQSANQSSQDQSSGEMMTTGSAMMYPGVIPNVGDMFVTNSWDGRRLIYTVKTTERKSILKDTCYSFDYEVVSYDDAVRYGDLVKKITKDYIFVRDLIYTNNQPLLVASEYDFYREGQQFLMDSQARYLKDFTHRLYQSFLIPDQEMSTYDPYLVSAAMKLIDGGIHHAKARIRQYNVDTGFPYEIETVWDGLLSLNGNERSGWATCLGIIETADFNHGPQYQSIRWSGIEAVYHALGNGDFAGTLPADFYLLDFGNGEIPRQSDLAPLTQKLPSNDVITKLSLDGLDLPDGESPPEIPDMPPLIHHISTDEYYVFTKAFYEQSEGQSVLEVEVNKALAGKKLSRTFLHQLVKDSARWTYLDRFYYLPVLWVLVKTSLAEM